MGSIFSLTHLALVTGELPRLINFIIFVVVLVFLVRKPLATFFQDRAQQIRRDLDQAREEREKARAQVENIKSQLHHLDESIVELKGQAGAEAEAEEKRIAAGAQADAAKLRAMADRQIESAMSAARLELKRFAAAQAVELTKEILRRELNQQDHQRLVERFNDQIREVRS